MYRIKQASRLSGVSEATLRAWERRYGVVAPVRTEAGYRLYDDEALARVSAMRHLVEAGWAAGQAAAAVQARTVPAVDPVGTAVEPRDAAGLTQRFLESAAAMDLAATEQALDAGFALGSFEHVVDTWLFPALVDLGEWWARGEVDVAAEHAASHAVHRRLAAAFEAAGTTSRGPAVVVGLPPGSLHELGALAFATALRRVGHHVLYLGADVPAASWVAAVQRHDAAAAVLAVPMADDRRPAADVTGLLLEARETVLVATGGAAGDSLTSRARPLASTIAAAARQLDELLVSNAA